jgi:small GTP-binding protein
MSRRQSFNQELTKKVILLGNAGVGKTSLAHRWIHHTFDPMSAPTVGASNFFKEITLETRTIKVTLWDTAGQEQFRAIAPLYVRGSRAAIVVTAADFPDSFHAIPNWLDLLGSTQVESIPAILAVNKIEILDPASDEELEKLIAMYGSHFVAVFYVSAATGERVDELFSEVGRIADSESVETSANALAQKEEPGASGCC